jgi:hypothetical protein
MASTILSIAMIIGPVIGYIDQVNKTRDNKRT